MQFLFCEHVTSTKIILCFILQVYWLWEENALTDNNSRQKLNRIYFFYSLWFLGYNFDFTAHIGERFYEMPKGLLSLILFEEICVYSAILSGTISVGQSSVWLFAV